MNNLCKKTIIITALTATATLSNVPAQAAVTNTIPKDTSTISTSATSKLVYAQNKHKEIMKKVKEMKTLRTIWIKKTNDTRIMLENKKLELEQMLKEYDISKKDNKEIEQLKNDVLLLEKNYKDALTTKNILIIKTKKCIIYASTWAEVIKKETIKINIIKQWGIYPLPISLETIKAYNFSKSEVIKIANATAWANTPHSRAVIQCESGGNYSINTGNGYYGAWQFDYSSWLANGGGRFSETANGAPKWAQDFVAYTYWSYSG